MNIILLLLAPVALAGTPAPRGWRPFLDPAPIPDALWFLTLVPLALGVAVVYKAVRVRTMDRYGVNVLVMTAQIVAAMVLLALGAHALVEWIVPALGG